jgi:hypothetical protein
MVMVTVHVVMSRSSCPPRSDWFLTVSGLDRPQVHVSVSDKSLTLGEPILSSYGSRLPEGQVGGGGSARTDQTADGGMVDLSGLTLRDLRDLRDRDDKSSLARALSRVLAGEADGHHSFSACI